MGDAMRYVWIVWTTFIFIVFAMLLFVIAMLRLTGFLK